MEERYHMAKSQIADAMLIEVISTRVPTRTLEIKHRIKMLENWLTHYEKTDYPGRPKTAQYYEIKEAYEKLNER